MTFRENRTGVVLIVVSGICGFLTGSVGHGTWQLAVETAQVLSGHVEYPRQNPLYLHHTKLWSLLHQVGAILLKWGLSEKTVSYVFSGLISAISFQALSLIVWSLSRNFILALTCPFVILYANATQHFAIYPVWITGTSNTHGVMGLALLVFSYGLFSAKFCKSAAFLLAALPAVHLSIGLLGWLIVGLVFMWNTATIRELSIGVTWSFVAGLIVSILSLLIHFLWTYDVPSMDSEIATRYLYAFVKNWDSHRHPVAFNNAGIYLNLAAMIISAIALYKFKSRFGVSLFLLRAIVVSAIVGLFFAVISWIPVDLVPSKLIIAMPARILEFNVLIFLALILGILGSQKNSLSFQFILVLFLMGLFVSRSLFVVYIPVITVAISAAFFLSEQDSKETRLLRPLGFLTVVLLIMTSLQTILKRENFHPDPYEWKKYALEDASNDAFFGKVSGFGKGMLLTSSDLHLIQLRTRRAVLLDGGQLDLLPYTCEAGPAIELILREVYGIDFFNPPDQAKRMASIRVNSNETLWEKRTQLEWTRIGKKFRVTEILTFSSWRLQLPVAEQNNNFTLYTIPEL